MKYILLFTVLIGVAACGNNDEKTVIEEKPAAPLTKSKNSDIFNSSFTLMLNQYFSLTDALIAEDDAAVNNSAKQMLQATDSIKITELKGDAGIAENASSFSQTIAAELKALLAEKDLTAKRKSFHMVTEALYNLVRIVQYDQSVIYQLSTDKAFENENGMATWLSTSKAIQNPYNPKKYLTDGTILDSLMYK